MAELAKLLGFMAPWDREAALRRYSHMFYASPDPQEVIRELGTPTKVAVALAADYVPSPPPESAAPAPEPRKAPEPEEDPISPAEIRRQLREAERAELEALTNPYGRTGEPAETPPARPTEAPPELPPEPPAEPAPPSPPKRRGNPAVLFFYWLLAIVIGVPVAVVLICVGLPFLAVGAGVCFAAVTTVLSGIGAFPLFSDVLLLVGAGLAALAVGLLAAWTGLWLSITLCSLWLTALGKLGRRLRYGKEAKAE